MRKILVCILAPLLFAGCLTPKLAEGVDCLLKYQAVKDFPMKVYISSLDGEILDKPWAPSGGKTVELTPGPHEITVGVVRSGMFWNVKYGYTVDLEILGMRTPGLYVLQAGLVRGNSAAWTLTLFRRIESKTSNRYDVVEEWKFRATRAGTLYQPSLADYQMTKIK